MEKKADKTPKRQRDPLEENTSTSNELEAVLKRRRLAVGGVENHNPEQRAATSPVRSRRLESEVKPDTPAIASVRLRVQQLTQRRDVGAALVQRCMSDPGTENPSSTLLRDVCHIGEGEFSSRLGRFKTMTPESSHAPSTPSTLQLSSFVHNMQQQLNTVMTPSTKEAYRIRQAREDELKSLKMQPLTENMWLKRSLSDPSLTEDDSSIDLKVAERRLNFSGVAETMGDSFSGTSTLTEEMQLPATEPCPPESVACPNEGMSTSTLIDKLFEDVLQEADREEAEEGRPEAEEGRPEAEEGRPEAEEGRPEAEEGRPEAEEGRPEAEEGQQNDSSVSENREDTTVETAKSFKSQSPSHEGAEEEEEQIQSLTSEEEEAEERKERTVCNEDDFLSLPPSCVLSPLSKSVEAAVIPMRLVPADPSPAVPCHPAEEVATPSAPPLYSIDAYRSQRKIPPPPSQTVAPPGFQKPPAKKSHLQPAVNTKGAIKALSEEASKLQTVINQTLQALSCCCDEQHGKGSLQEAEAEKLLLVSSEKHAALLAEISRLREGGAGKQLDPEHLQPCRGTVRINNIQLPLKVEFLCSVRPIHYFFILIRYGVCNIVATPLATAADAENGDTISFPTSITLQDIRSNFEIDVEVYSLCNSAANSSSANVQQHRSSTRSKATPRKLLSSIKKSSPCSTSGAVTHLDPQRSSNFSLVGSYKLTLSSLGQSKFLLDKMKFEGKLRRLLGDEFQEKVPFLSPLEGHIYLRLHSESHTNVQHQGFLTMFEDVSGFGAWQRLFFKLEGVTLCYWNHPNETGSKPAEGSICLCSYDGIRPVQRDSCARPHTFELVSSRTLQQEHSPALTKSWFAADTREERADWMEKLNQVLLDFHTWSRHAAVEDGDRADASSITATSHESIL